MSVEPVLHSLAISQVILHYAAEQGVDEQTCLAGTEITSDLLGDGAGLISPEQEMRLIENLILALPDRPAAGFELGLRYTVATFGAWGFALRTSRNLRQAIERALRYLPLSTAYCRFSTAIADGVFELRVDPREIPVHLRQFLLERDLGTAIQLIQELNLGGQPIRSLRLSGPTPSYASRMEALCGLPISFGQAVNALGVSLEDAERPLPTYDEHLVRLLEDQCRQLLQRRQIGGIAGQVRQQLLGALGLMASLEDMAAALHMSARSLRRKLDSEGTSYRAVLEEARRQMADQLLRSTTMKIEEMAVHLGYADTASFTRAFRRWHGTSPGQYRDSCR